MAEQLRNGSILDQLRLAYPAGAAFLPLPKQDPGRVRNRAFFDKMYGDCKLGQVAPALVPIVWLPKTWAHVLRITSVNGVDRQLTAISRELDELPAEDKYVYPPENLCVSAGRRHWRERGMHGWGAPSISTSLSDYWLWRPPVARQRM
jgi:hypothetical protein